MFNEQVIQLHSKMEEHKNTLIALRASMKGMLTEHELSIELSAIYADAIRLTGQADETNSTGPSYTWSHVLNKFVLVFDHTGEGSPSYTVRQELFSLLSEHINSVVDLYTLYLLANNNIAANEHFQDDNSVARLLLERAVKSGLEQNIFDATPDLRGKGKAEEVASEVVQTASDEVDFDNTQAETVANQPDEEPKAVAEDEAFDDKQTETVADQPNEEPKTVAEDEILGDKQMDVPSNQPADEETQNVDDSNVQTASDNDGKEECELTELDITGLDIEDEPKPAIENTYYNLVGNNGRIHMFAASVYAGNEGDSCNGKSGDALKHAILEQFREAFVTHGGDIQAAYRSIENSKDKIMILEKGQGFATRLFSLETSSITVLRAMANGVKEGGFDELMGLVNSNESSNVI